MKKQHQPQNKPPQKKPWITLRSGTWQRDVTWLELLNAEGTAVEINNVLWQGDDDPADVHIRKLFSLEETCNVMRIAWVVCRIHKRIRIRIGKNQTECSDLFSAILEVGPKVENYRHCFNALQVAVAPVVLLGMPQQKAFQRIRAAFYDSGIRVPTNAELSREADACVREMWTAAKRCYRRFGDSRWFDELYHPWMLDEIRREDRRCRGS